MLFEVTMTSKRLEFQSGRILGLRALALILPL